MPREADRAAWSRRPPLGLQLPGLRGLVATTPFGFAVYRSAELAPDGLVDWPAGGGAEYHRRICLFLAHIWFGRPYLGRAPGGRLRLREHVHAAPPAGFARWGWTRETRPVGFDQVWVTDYLVLEYGSGAAPLAPEPTPAPHDASTAS